MLCAARIEREPFSPPVVEQMGTDASLKLRVPAGGSRDHVESVGFIDLLPTGVDAAIREAQRCIVEALDLDGSTLFEPSDDGDLLATHSWWRPERSGAARTCVGQGELSRGCSRGSWQASWSASRAPTSCRTASTARACFASACKSIVVIPLSVARADRRRRELRCDAQRAATGLRRLLQRLRLVGEHVRQRARPAAQRRGAPPGARRGQTPERSAARGERVPAPRSRKHARHVHRRPERRDSPRARAGAPGGRDRCDGPPSGRDRLRQRGVRVADS